MVWGKFSYYTLRGSITYSRWQFACPQCGEAESSTGMKTKQRIAVDRFRRKMYFIHLENGPFKTKLCSISVSAQHILNIDNALNFCRTVLALVITFS